MNSIVFDQSRDDPALSLLWPGDSSAQQTFRVIPNRREPRFVIPDSPRTVAVKSFIALRDNSTPKARRRNQFLARIWGRGWTPGELLQLPDGGICETLGELLGTEVVCAVHLGPPRANRKPVLVVMSPDGVVLGFAKVGVDHLTDRLVSNEAAALRQASAIDGLLIPELLAEQLWHEHALVVQSPLHRPTRRRDDPAVILSAQVALAASATGSMLEYVTRLRDRVQEIPAGASDSRTSETRTANTKRLSALLARYAETARLDGLPVGPWHGDWRSTNMQVTPEGVAVWDWERFDPAVPRGFDALHYQLMSHAPREPDALKLVPWLMDQSASMLAAFGVGEGSARTVTAFYLMELASRYLADGQEKSGARLGDVSQWLLPSLEQELRASTEGTQE